MKLFIVLGLLFFKISSGYLPESLLSWRDYQCIGSLNIGTNIVKEAYDDYLILEEGNPLIEAYAECMFKQKEYMNKDGSFDFRKIKDRAIDIFNVFETTAQDKYAIIDEALAACETVKGVNLGATAIKMHNCLFGFVREYTNSTKTFLKS